MRDRRKEIYARRGKEISRSDKRSLRRKDRNRDKMKEKLEFLTEEKMKFFQAVRKFMLNNNYYQDIDNIDAEVLYKLGKSSFFSIKIIETMKFEGPDLDIREYDVRIDIMDLDIEWRKDCNIIYKEHFNSINDINNRISNISMDDLIKPFGVNKNELGIFV